MFFCEKEKRWCSVWSCERSKCEFSGEGRAAGLYKTVNGVYTNDDLSVSKTVRLYPETLEVIEGYRGEELHGEAAEPCKRFCKTKSGKCKTGRKWKD